ncbi:MAG TPA: hypothetical protein VKU01_25970 [Bryobacteraceae bacterium]|nr:hypothetical protein [Bryobacteraceae bacterium]
MRKLMFVACSMFVLALGIGSSFATPTISPCAVAHTPGPVPDPWGPGGKAA